MQQFLNMNANVEYSKLIYQVYKKEFPSHYIIAPVFCYENKMSFFKCQNMIVSLWNIQVQYTIFIIGVWVLTWTVVSIEYLFRPLYLPSFVRAELSPSTQVHHDSVAWKLGKTNHVCEHFGMTDVTNPWSDGSVDVLAIKRCH